jgi:uncharacterized protein (TIGR00369 family)
MTQVEHAAVDPRLVQRISEVLIGSPVARTLGIALLALTRDRAVLGLPFSPGNVTLGDTVHGGVIATLIDAAGVAAAASGADAENLRGSATATLAISYLAPAQGTALRAEAAVVRRGARQVVADVAVLADDTKGTLIAKALVTVSLF